MAESRVFACDALRAPRQYYLGLAVALLGLGPSLSGAASTELISEQLPGPQTANGDSSRPMISADGNFVVFVSDAPDLVAGDTNDRDDVFVRNLSTGAVERISLSPSGAQANNNSGPATISANGRFVAFSSLASNLVAGDTNGVSDVFVRDRQTGITQRISVSASASR